MAKTNDQVAHLFAHHQAGDSNNMHSDGTTLKSYSTVIAFWEDGVCFVSSDNMSATTGSKHLNPLKRALSYQYFGSPAFSWGGGTPSAMRCIQEAAKEMQESFKKLCRKRANLDYALNWYTERRDEILEMARRFNVGICDMPEANGDLKEKAKELAKKDRERRAEETKRREESERAQRIIGAGQLDLWLQQGRGHYPRSFQVRGADQLTIKNGFTLCSNAPCGAEIVPNGEGSFWWKNDAADTVITSQGAEVPLSHVIRALKFYDARRVIGAIVDEHLVYEPYHTNGHKIALGAFVLGSIDEAGNVRAGCHTFTVAEIARFRAQWGL